MRIAFAALLLATFCAEYTCAQEASGQSSPSRANTPATNSQEDIKILFTGDILLSRGVAAEIARRKESPWKNLAGLFHRANWVAGNLEGAVGSSSDCLESSERSPCFAVDSSLLHFLREAAFSAVGNENNHAGNLGLSGRDATRKALASNGLLPLTFAASPAFLRFGGKTIAVISVNEIPDRAGKPTELPSVAVEQKLRLARALGNLVFVSIHWGDELMDWPSQRQRQDAAWLVAHGADAVFGSHPHVIQEPECVSGKPVFFSLGNHVFDQKCPATKEGLIADCRIRRNVLRCSGLRTHTPIASSFPELAYAYAPADDPLASCQVRLRSTLTISGYALRPQPSLPETTSREIWMDGVVSEGPQAGRLAWRTRPAEVLSLETGKLAGPNDAMFLFALEKHPSPIDSENDPRPYVYEVGRSGLIARWRGSALAWPLVDAQLLSGQDGVLCALHRDDSFLMLSPQSKATRVAAYRWNGFGFDGIDAEATVSACRNLFGIASPDPEIPGGQRTK